MSAGKQDAYHALENLEHYLHGLEGKPDSEELKPALTSAIVAIRSKVFQELKGLQEFYEETLDNASKPMNVKAEETRCLAKKWDDHGSLPIPVTIKPLAQHSISPSHELPCGDTVVIIEREAHEGLGLTISGGIDNPHVPREYGIIITKLIPNTVAEKCGKIQQGDQIMSVNGVSLEAVTHAECVEVLKNSGTRVEMVIRRSYHSRSPEFIGDVSESRQEIKVLSSPEPSDRYTKVVLKKNKGSGLGFVLVGGKDNQHVDGDNGIFVTKIIPNSPTHEEGTIAVGDRILEVDGHSLRDTTHHEAVSLLKGTGNRVVFKIEKNALQHVTPMSPYKLKLSEQDDSDRYKPRYVTLHRPEGKGLGFKIICGKNPPGIFISDITLEGMAVTLGKVSIGDEILEVNDQDVVGWSQAKVAQTLKTAGTTVTLRVVYKPEAIEKITAYQPVIRQQLGNTNVCPVVILGPLKEDIGRMLVREFPNEFAGCVPHTTRQPHEGEVNGLDYHFVESVDEMEKGIQANLFIEFGSYKGNLYGTSIQAVRDVLDQRKHCVLAVSAHALSHLVMANFVPLVLCIRPSDFSVIVKASEQNSSEDRVTDEQAQQMIDDGRNIEKEFGNMLAAVVEGRSLDELHRKVIEAIHFEKQAWMDSNEQPW